MNFLFIAAGVTAVYDIYLQENGKYLAKLKKWDAYQGANIDNIEFWKIKKPYFKLKWGTTMHNNIARILGDQVFEWEWQQKQKPKSE